MNPRALLFALATACGCSGVSETSIYEVAMDDSIIVPYEAIPETADDAYLWIITDLVGDGWEFRVRDEGDASITQRRPRKVIRWQSDWPTMNVSDRVWIASHEWGHAMQHDTDYMDGYITDRERRIGLELQAGRLQIRIAAVLDLYTAESTVDTIAESTALSVHTDPLTPDERALVEAVLWDEYDAARDWMEAQ